MWRLNLAGQELAVRNEDELREYLALAREGQPAEVWLQHPLSGHLLLLSNGREAFLMHLPDVDGDHPGWTTRVTANEEWDEPVSGFVLSNGQVDGFPRSWVVPLREGINALMHFYDRGERAPWLSWHDDSLPK